MLSGCLQKFDTDPLDLLDGVQVLYRTWQEAGQATVETNANVVQMTRGCAAFILMTPDEQLGKSICVIKQCKAEWRNFATRNSVAMQHFVDQKAKCWKKYQYRETNGSYRFWWFNLCGKLSYDAAATEEKMSTTTADIQFRQIHWNKEFHCSGKKGKQQEELEKTRVKEEQPPSLVGFRPQDAKNRGTLSYFV